MRSNIFGSVLLTVCLFSLLFADCVLAQPAGGRGGPRGGGRGAMMMGGLNSNMGLLNSEEVQAELELVDDQIAELKAIQQSATESMRNMFAEMQDLPRDQQRQAMTNMRDKLQERMKTFADQADEVLLPHQRDRLKQLGYQANGRGRGAGGAMNDEMMDELNLTDKQREEIAEATKKAQEELKKEYAKLVARAEDQILEALDSGQRKKYRELVGEPFQFEDNTNRFQRQRRRGQEGDREKSDR